jgi:hypothetical protein
LLLLIELKNAFVILHFGRSFRSFSLQFKMSLMLERFEVLLGNLLNKGMKLEVFDGFVCALGVMVNDVDCCS